jgi:endoglucanase
MSLQRLAMMAFVVTALFPAVTESRKAGSPADFFCTFSSSPADCGFTEQAKAIGRATIVDIGRDDGTAVRLHTAAGDNDVYGSGTWERTDLALSQGATACYDGWEAWWSHSALFPDDYVVPPNGGGGVIMNFHDTSNSGTPNFSVEAMPHPVGLRLTGYGGNSIGAGKYQVTLGPVVKNAWYDFVYHVRWSSRSDGFMNVWVNGVQKIAHKGPTLYKRQGCYLKLANLHSPFGLPSSVIHDRVMRGTTREAVWPSATVANPAPALAGNPLQTLEGYANFYVEPDTIARREANRLRQQGSFTQADLIEKIASNAVARWFGAWNWDVRSDVHDFVSAASAAGAVPMLVAYNIPDRDCGGFSAGGAASASEYRAWIRSVATGIGGRKALVVLEPDALALNNCLSAHGKGVRDDLLKDAIAVLKAQNALVYLDAGNANWIGDADMAARLKNAGVSQADGFALNVSNFYTTPISVSYGDRVSALTGGKRYVVDTSRNGRGSNGEWCNPSGRGLGVPATANTGMPLVDAYLWVKRPGESDGTCNGGPSAGTWWLDYALGLAQNSIF